MSNTDIEIVPGAAVTLHLSLTLCGGTEAISTFQEEPLSFRMGDHTLQPGMEWALYGLKSGDTQTITLSPEQAYGLPDPELLQTLPLTVFNDQPDPEPGQMIYFTFPDGKETLGRVCRRQADNVEVDFNHPLAGHEVIFRVEILKVVIEEPT